jgi:hypothetical protein
MGEADCSLWDLTDAWNGVRFITIIYFDCRLIRLHVRCSSDQQVRDKKALFETRSDRYLYIL